MNRAAMGARWVDYKGMSYEVPQGATDAEAIEECKRLAALAKVDPNAVPDVTEAA